MFPRVELRRTLPEGIYRYWLETHAGMQQVFLLLWATPSFVRFCAGYANRRKLKVFEYGTRLPGH
jgi:hypothetical protein